MSTHSITPEYSCQKGLNNVQKEMDSTTAQIRIRQAAPSDVDAVTAVLLAAMPGDRDWWDYRFPYRTQYPEDHRKFFRLLIETWVSPEFEDSVVMVAEAYDGAAGVWRMGAYAAWDVSYLSYRKYGAAYKPRKGTPPTRLYAEPLLLFFSDPRR